MEFDVSYWGAAVAGLHSFFSPCILPIVPFYLCYMAGLSGGGYAIYHPGYDWWAHRTPRLYELLFCSAPCYNWLPDGYSPVRDWDSPRARARWEWLRRWSAYHRAVAMSRLVSHRFLSDDWKLQRVEFANGVAAEFDLARDRYRVTGVEGFTGEWEDAPEL